MSSRRHASSSARSRAGRSSAQTAAAELALAWERRLERIERLLTAAQRLRKDSAVASRRSRRSSKA
jgi:hypothetical protein